MAVFNCPECGGLSHADHEATYYWCDCGQPLTAANAVPGMADGVADQTASVPPAAPAKEKPAPLPSAEEQDDEQVEGVPAPARAQRELA